MLDRLTRLIERAGYEVVVAATPMTAQAQLDRQRVDCVVCGWDSARAAPFLSRVLAGSPLLAEKFVFFGHDTPANYYRITGSRGEVVNASAPDAYELLVEAVTSAIGNNFSAGEDTLVDGGDRAETVADTTAVGPPPIPGRAGAGAGTKKRPPTAIDPHRRPTHDPRADTEMNAFDKPTARGEAIDLLADEDTGVADMAADLAIDLDSEEMTVVEVGMPTLLVVDDEPLELRAMERFLSDYGFAVTVADGCHAAMDCMSAEDYDIILVDWYMHDGSGPDVLQWVAENKPHLSARIVFVSGADPKQVAASGRPFFPKGQDSAQLMRLLVELCRMQNRPLPARAT